MNQLVATFGSREYPNFEMNLCPENSQSIQGMTLFRINTLTKHTNLEALVGVRKFSRVETGMGVTFRP